MSLSHASCAYCGNTFEAAPNAKFYSILVDDAGYLTDVIEGELIPGAFHYCSESCMFKREQGVITRINFFHIAGDPFLRG